MKKLMMIGFGAMGREVAAHLPKDLQLTWIVVPENMVEQIKGDVSSKVNVISSIEECKGTPDFVVEAAGQMAIREHGVKVLKRGWRLGIISVGSLADQALFESLLSAAKEGQTQFHLMSGAVAGIDGLSAAKEGGLTKVTYRGTKAPRSWKGSHAEELIDLESVQEKQCFFKGSAREAATLFPANANVAATIALAGVGMDTTEVELFVDPESIVNQHKIYVEGRFGQFEIELNGKPLESNPKTSTLAALSVIRACRQIVSPWTI